MSNADFSANSIGVIGDSQDKRYTFVRTDGKAGREPPEHIYAIDWHAVKTASPHVLLHWASPMLVEATP